MKNTSKLILISGGFGNGNSGDEALLVCMYEQLKEKMNSAEIVAFSDDVEVSRRFFDSVEYIYSGRFGLKDRSEQGLRSYLWILKTFRTIFKADILLTGGGTILQDSTHPFFVPFWFAKIFLAWLLGTPNMFYGIGVGPLERLSSKILMNTLGTRVLIFTLRGPVSESWVHKFNIPKDKVLVTADPAVTLKPASAEEVEQILTAENACLEGDGRTVIICIRQWYKLHKKSLEKKEWLEGGEEKYNNLISSISQFSEQLLRQGNKILFLPMSIYEPNDDRIAASDVIDALQSIDGLPRNYRSINGDYSPSETKGILGKADVVVSLRFHPLIYATMQQVPVIGVAYGLKTRDYLSYIEMQDFAIDVDDISAEWLLNAYARIVENYPATKDLLREKSNLMMSQAARNAEIVLEILEKKS